MTHQVRFDLPVTMLEAVKELVRTIGKDPAQIYAVVDLKDAMAATRFPEFHTKEYLVMFTDWTFAHIDTNGLVRVDVN